MALERSVRGWGWALAALVLAVVFTGGRWAVALAAGPSSLPAEAEARAEAKLEEIDSRLKERKFAEARALAEEIVRDGALKDSRHYAKALLRHGRASLELEDYVSAGRSLARLAPFEMVGIGTEARYLLGRVHHLSDEWPEAVANYEGAIAAYGREKSAADMALSNPAGIKRVDVREQLIAIARAGTPEHVTWSAIHLADILLAQGKAAEALNVASAAMGRAPAEALAVQLRLRAGMAQVRLGKFSEAGGLLEPLENDAAVGVEALRWMARATLGMAGAVDGQARAEAHRAAAERLKKAGALARSLVKGDGRGEEIHAQILLELGDVLVASGRAKEAASVYESIKVTGDLAEAALAKRAGALAAAGEHGACEAACAEFFKSHRYSPHSAEVGLWFAKNALGRAAQGDVKAGEEAVDRFKHVVDRFSDTAQAHAARRGLGVIHYRAGAFAMAAKALAEIPELERVGELADVSYYQGDSLMQTLPIAAEDAISSARLLKQLEQAIVLLSAATSAERGEHLPDAYMKLGIAQGRLAELMADPAERTAALHSARASLEHLRRFQDRPQYAMSLYERSRILTLLNDWGGALNDLSSFQKEPLSRSGVAPRAMARLGEYLRAQRRFTDSAKVLKRAIEEHGPQLKGDAEKIAVLAAMRLGLGRSLMESGNWSEARDVFAQVAREFPGLAEAEEAAWRGAQCDKEQAVGDLKNARQRGDAKAIARAVAALEKTAEALEQQASSVREKAAGSDAHLRLRIEAAEAWRAVGEGQIAEARRAAADSIKKRLEDRRKDRPAGVDIPPVAVGEVDPGSIALAKGEIKAREAYAAVIGAEGESPLINEARLALARMHADRGEHELAVKLLSDAVEGEVAGSIADRMRLALAVSLVEKGDLAAGESHLAALAQDVKSAQSPAARRWLGEVYFRQKDWSRAVAQLLAFRQEQALRTIPDVSDQAMLRLGQAYGNLGDWNASRSALESGLRRFSEGPVASQMRYAMGTALEKTDQLDAAIAAYDGVIKRGPAGIAAMAQYRIGRCRKSQGRTDEALKHFVAAGFSYEISDSGGKAMVEAAGILFEMKRDDEARRILDRVLKEHPAGEIYERAMKIREGK